VTASRLACDRFLEAVASRDLDRVTACFTADATWANVPHPIAVGSGAIRAMFAPILGRSERVEWEIVSAAYQDRLAWLERVDRFWIDGEEYWVECNGVFVVADDGERLREVRDYVDLTPWRARLTGVLGSWTAP